MKADAVAEFKAELETVAEIEQNNKYNYAFNIIVNDKKFCEIWSKTDVMRVTVCKRNLEKLADFKLVNFEERTAIRREKDTNEEYTVETEFILTKEECIELVKYIVEYATQKTEEKKNAEQKKESKAEQKKAKQSKAEKKSK
jgi:hypothetical protein